MMSTQSYTCTTLENETDDVKIETTSLSLRSASDTSGTIARLRKSDSKHSEKM